LSFGFQDDFLFAPGSVSSGAGLHGEQGYDFAGELHGGFFDVLQCAEIRSLFVETRRLGIIRCCSWVIPVHISICKSVSILK
jgi:hypothetical protein